MAGERDGGGDEAQFGGHSTHNVWGERLRVAHAHVKRAGQRVGERVILSAAKDLLFAGEWFDTVH